VLETWTLFILRRSKAVLGLWLVALALALVATARLPQLLTNHFELPGTDSDRAEKILQAQFGQRTVGAFTLVVHTNADAHNALAVVRQAAAQAAAALPSGRVSGVAVLSDHVAAARIVSSLTSAQAKSHTVDMRAAMRAALPAASGPLDGVRFYLTGFAAIEHDLDPILQADLRTGELLIALPIAVVMLAWTFGTMAFLVPLVFALCTVPTTLGLVYLVALNMELTTYVTNLVGLIGLGIAIDYSLLMVYRYREEANGPASAQLAIVRTMQTAGRAVAVSGLAVAVGLALLVFLPLPFLRGFGIGGLFIPLVSVLAAFTLLPVLLLLLAGPLDRVYLLPGTQLTRRGATGHGFWPALAHSVMRRPWPVAAGSTAVLLLMAAPLLTIELGPGSRDSLPRSVESIQGLDLVAAAIGAGATVPSAILIDSGRDDGVYEPLFARAVGRLMKGLSADPQVAAVRFARDRAQHVDRSGRYANVEVDGRQDFGTPQSQALVDRIRGQIVPAALIPHSAMVLVGGAPAAGRDFLGLAFGSFPALVAAILVVTYVLLLRAFRSLLLPFKAVVLNLLSIGAAYGLTVAVFSWGWGAPFGLIRESQINVWIPVLVFAMLFGLSMDYEVFIVCRMREAWDGGVTNDEAVAAGLAATGRLVTSAGLIMCAAFAGFVAGSIVELQQFGFALAVAVLVDVTIVRALLLPAAMKLFGSLNWYLPEVIGRALRVPPPSRKKSWSDSSDARPEG
jgi:RND superfamily putative drug exporter